MPPTPLALVEYLRRNNTSTDMINWPLICTGAYIESTNTKSNRNDTATNQRRWLEITKSRSYWISTSSRPHPFSHHTRHHRRWKKQKKKSQNVSSSTWLFLVILITKSKKVKRLKTTLTSGLRLPIEGVLATIIPVITIVSVITCRFSDKQYGFWSAQSTADVL